MEIRNTTPDTTFRIKGGKKVAPGESVSLVNNEAAKLLRMYPGMLEKANFDPKAEKKLVDVNKEFAKVRKQLEEEKQKNEELQELLKEERTAVAELEQLIGSESKDLEPKE